MFCVKKQSYAMPISRLTDLKPQRRNANRHTQRGMGALERSIQQDGWIGAITVAADGETFDGSARIEVGAASGFEDAIVVRSKGDRPIVHVREDIPTADDPRAVRLGVAANRVAQLDYDPDAELLAQLQEEHEGILDGLYTGDELDALLDGLGLPESDVLESSLAEAVPDALYPSDNEWGIPMLDIRKQADALVMPVVKWGVQGRGNRMEGTYHFYTHDYKFSALWDDPRPLVRSGCPYVIEPNFSTLDELPLIAALYRIYQKRWLARYWQENGIKVLVDLNVSISFAEHNLIGVPKGWRAYATRGLDNSLELVQNDFQIACNHAGTDDVLFVVIGGRATTKQLCGEKGWVHVPEGFNMTWKGVTP